MKKTTIHHDTASDNEYDIAHLERHVVEYIQKATQTAPERRYRVRVSYSDHCYTKATPAADRVFDEKRYELSKQLPQIISELMNRECHHTGRTNFVTFDIDESQTYEIYFEVFKKEGLNLRVQSAYIRDQARMGSRPGRAKIRFSTILYNVLNDKPIHPPRQKR